MSLHPFTSPSALPESTPDDQIVRRVLAGDSALFELLVRRYSQRIFRTMRAILNTDDVDDAVQQAFINAYTHLNQFAGRSSFSTWLTRIAINEGRGRLRPTRRNAAMAVNEDDVRDTVPSVDPNPEQQMMSSEFQKAVHDGIDSLPETYRAVLQMRQIDGLSTADVARRLGVQNDVVKTRLYRARRIVRDSIEDRLSRN